MNQRIHRVTAQSCANTSFIVGIIVGLTAFVPIALSINYSNSQLAELRLELTHLDYQTQGTGQ
jgi:hypothetical protein